MTAEADIGTVMLGTRRYPRRKKPEDRGPFITIYAAADYGGDSEELTIAEARELAAELTRIADAVEPECEAALCHGPGHQSQTRCEVRGAHQVHRCVYGGERQEAEWRDGEYTGKLRAQGIKFNEESYPENLGMTGFSDEPPQDTL